MKVNKIGHLNNRDLIFNHHMKLIDDLNFWEVHWKFLKESSFRREFIKTLKAMPKKSGEVKQ